VYTDTNISMERPTHILTFSSQWNRWPPFLRAGVLTALGAFLWIAAVLGPCMGFNANTKNGLTCLLQVLPTFPYTVVVGQFVVAFGVPEDLAYSMLGITIGTTLCYFFIGAVVGGVWNAYRSNQSAARNESSDPPSTLY